MLKRLMTIPSQDQHIQRRGRTILSVCLVLLALLLIAIVPLSFRPDPLPSVLAIVFGALVVVAAMGLARAGRVAVAAWALVILSTAAVMLPVLLRAELSSTLLYLVLPVVIAGVILRPWQLWPVLAIILLLIGYKATTLPPDALADANVRALLQNCSLIITTIGVISFIGAQIAERAFGEAAAARRAAEEAAAGLAQLNADLEGQVQARTAELQQALAAARAQADERQALLDEIAAQQSTIREMNVPVLPVRAGTLVMPLVGDLDGERLETIQSRALQAIEDTQADTLLIDLTGVSVVDTLVAQGLVRTVQSARLLGTTPVLIGIRPEVAQSIVGLGIDLAEVRTAASLASALSSGNM